MQPSHLAFELRTALTEYLTTTYAIGDDTTRERLVRFLTDPAEGIFRGPYVHLRAPYRQVDRATWDSPLEWFPPELIPFVHQDRAWRRLSSWNHEPEPTIVRTGTGSGKTEAFLIPILDHCRRARAAGQEGIKALLLYPMNALATDQAGRLARLIHDHHELGQVTAGLYLGADRSDGPGTGGGPGPAAGSAGSRATMGPDHLIDSRQALRERPPDILLTNYKMLDFLLLRREDRDLWAANEPDTLRYVVLDEAHTYTGAQGSDVALLLRRLGLRLGMARPGRPLGRACPVATSATLGSGSDSDAALARFVAQLTGCPVDQDAVIGDERLAVTELGKVDFAHPIPDPAELARIDTRDHLQVARQFLDHDFAEPLDGPAFALTLGRLLPTHHLTHVVLEAAAERPVTWSEALDRICARTPEWGRARLRSPDRVDAALTAFLGLLSWARVADDRTGRTRPLVTVQVQLWVREVSRLDRIVHPDPAFVWTDRGFTGSTADTLDAASAEPTAVSLPAIYCRICGRTGWASVMHEADGRLAHDGAAIRRRWAERSRRVRSLIAAQPGEPDAQWYDPDRRSLVGPATDPKGNPLDPPAARHRRRRRAVCVLVTPSDDAARQGRCPSCDNLDAIRFLGTQIASLASAALAELFGSERFEPEEPKLLAFTDSVQDAAHRSGFISARTYRFNLRTRMTKVLLDHGAPLPLDGLGDLLVQDVFEGGPAVIHEAVPADLVRDPRVRTLWTDRPDPRAREMLAARLRFETILEFGLFSRVGRTLELTRSLAATVTPPDPAAMERAVTAALSRHLFQGRLAAYHLDPERVRTFVRGLLERLRLGGAIFHPLLDPFVASNGQPYFIWGGRPPGLPPFPTGQSRPRFLSTRRSDTFDPLDTVLAHTGTTASTVAALATRPLTWWADWAIRALGVDRADARRAIAATISALESCDVVEGRPERAGGTVYGLRPGLVSVFDVPDRDGAGRPGIDDGAEPGDPASSPLPVTSMVRCPVCTHRHAVPPLRVAEWVGSPCLRYRCPGRYREDPADQPSSYRRRYRSGRTRRIVAAEHTGQLDRQTREATETAFKRGDRPDAPNVLVCTPTLEMGIDIGDLSAVMLTSLPRGGTASYVQRVGRAGRASGNALVTLFAPTEPLALYYLADPLRLIAGDIRPPACTLDSLDLLVRQFVAFLLDEIAAGRVAGPALPRDAIDVLGPGAFQRPESLLARVVAAPQENRELVERFLAGVSGEVSPSTAQALRDWTVDGLADHVRAGARRWQDGLRALELRRDRINRRIAELTGPRELDHDDAEDLRLLRGERAALARQITEYRRTYAPTALEAAGLLPTFSLVEETTELDVTLWSDTRTGTPEVVLQQRFTRPARFAVRELAPGNAFYAQGHRLVIDAVDLGGSSEPETEQWRLCPDCGFGEQEAAFSASGAPTCPRCGLPGIADLGARHRLVRLRRVACQDLEERARFEDETDERTQERYGLVTTVDIDPAHVVRAFALTNTTFGVELTTRATLRFLNFGRIPDQPGAQIRVGGQAVSAPRFRVCQWCGVVDGARPGAAAATRHRGWCLARRARREAWQELALMHETTTQALRVLLPVGVVEADDRLETLAAVLRLVLRSIFGDDPDHLEVLSVQTPAGSSQVARRTFLVVADTVPGGSGYLERVADAETIRTELARVRPRIADCPCAAEGLAACHRCLLGVARRAGVRLVSRALALELIDELLDGWTAEPVPTVAQVSVDALEESELERRFRACLVAFDAWRDDVTIVEAPGGRQQGYELRFLATASTGSDRHQLVDEAVPSPTGPEPAGSGSDGGAAGTDPDDPLAGPALRTRTRWRLREQVDVEVPGALCRPDFLLTRLDGPPVRVAVFTDGYRYHASPDHPRVGDDAVKRQALLDAGYVVWQLTWEDVTAFADAVGAATPRKPAPNPVLELDVAVLQQAALQIDGRIDHRLATANPLWALLAFLEDPDLDVWEGLARAALSAVFPLGTRRAHPREATRQVLETAFAGSWTTATVAETDVDRADLLTCTLDELTVLVPNTPAAAAHQRFTVVASLDDTPDALADPDGQRRWRRWLAWANLAQFLRSDGRQFALWTRSLCDGPRYPERLDHLELLGPLASADEQAGVERPTSRAPGAALDRATGRPHPDLARLLADADVRVARLVVAAVGENPELAHGLVVGWEVDDPDLHGWLVEAAWPDRRIAVTLDDGIAAEDAAARNRWLADQRWTVRDAADWTAESLRAALVGTDHGEGTTP